MRMMMLTGAMLGFGVGLAFGLTRESSWPTVIWQASVAAYVAGILARWWAGHWIRNLREALVVKHAETIKSATAGSVAGAAAGAGAANAGAAASGGPTNTNKR